MRVDPTQLRLAIQDAHDTLSEVYKTHRGLWYDEINPDWGELHLESTLEALYLKLLAIAEAIEMPLLRQQIEATFREARRDGLCRADLDDDGEPRLRWTHAPWQFLVVLKGVFAGESDTAVTRELEAVLRACAYSVGDRRIFPGPPADEAELHLRIEAILRCVFPDLLHKPALAKPIKNFQPDTGLPSVRTLIEYKYLKGERQVAGIADELLADTRGYAGKEWAHFVYVIYETQRFRPETSWNQLMRDCGVGVNTRVIVLSGEPCEG